MFGMILTTSIFTKRETEQARQAIEAAMGLLPNVKRIVLTLTLSGHDVPECQEKRIVACALDWASPLKGFPGLSLEGDDYATDQRTRIMGEVRRALGC